jgi:hypothetical protein
MIEAMMMAAGAKNQVSIQDIFNVSLYPGTGTTQKITTGCNLKDEDGLLWIKNRQRSTAHALYINDNGFFVSTSGGGVLSSTGSGRYGGSSAALFEPDGFTLSTDTAHAVNNYYVGEEYVAWTFRRSKKFMDVVRYTGYGGAKFPHNLGTKPGMVVAKRTDDTSNWYVWHHSAPGLYFSLDAVNAGYTGEAPGYTSQSTEDYLQLSYTAMDGGQGGSWIAYLFAHDPSDSGVIQCGAYAGNSSSVGPEINLGWKPQYLIVKRVNDTSHWMVFDLERGVANPDKWLGANDRGVEQTLTDAVDFTANGFRLKSSHAGLNASTSDYIYMAIRAPEPE